MFDRYIVGQNQLTHYKNKVELEIRIKLALELFDMNPKLIELRKD